MPPAEDAVQTMTNEKETTASHAAGRISELRVSANLMTLDTGVYCVFPSPGSPAPDVATGLPGVRITRCPGIVDRPEAVSISTFRDDGWLDNTAALVRVTDGSARVLVTIYQIAGQPGETAPRLQVLRLAGDPAAAGPEFGTPVSRGQQPDVMAHIQASGDVPGQFGGWLGKRGSRNWIEGFGLSDKGPLGPGSVEYQGVLGRGWLSPWVENGKFCGSRGMALPLLGLSVRLKGAAAEEYTMRYSATFIDGSAVGPVAEGIACESPGLAALESFLIELVPKSQQSESGGSRTTTSQSSVPRVAPKQPARSARR